MKNYVVTINLESDLYDFYRTKTVEIYLPKGQELKSYLEGLYYPLNVEIEESTEVDMEEDKILMA